MLIEIGEDRDLMAPPEVEDGITLSECVDLLRDLRNNVQLHPKYDEAVNFSILVLNALRGPDGL